MPNICSVDSCDGTVKGWGYCQLHYRRFMKHGDPLVGGWQGHPAGMALDYIYKTSTIDTDECVLWPYGMYSTGYGAVRFRNKTIHASRVMAFVCHGEPIDISMEAAHSCGVRACVNPKHLRWATRSENALDKRLHGTMLQGSGHPFAKLTEADVIFIKQNASSKHPKELAKILGVHRVTVSHVIKGNWWKQVQS